MPNSYKLTTPFLFKTIRTGKDEEDCWGDFVAGLLGAKKSLRDERKQFTIRLGRPAADSKRRYEIVPNKGKTPLFTLDEKKDFTKHQSTSYCEPSVYHPSYFGRGKREILVGMRFDLKDALLQRIMMYDEGTFQRPYDHDTREDALEYLDNKLSKKHYHQSLDSLVGTGKKLWLGQYNEVMARLRFSLDGSMQVVVFSNNLEARLLAQARRSDLERALLGRNPDSIRIPISFYHPLGYYSEQEQQNDLIKARSSKDSKIIALRLFLEKSETDFNKLSSAEWDLVWPIINKMSDATKGAALNQYLQQMSEDDARNYLSGIPTKQALRFLVSSPYCGEKIKRLFFEDTKSKFLNLLDGVDNRWDSNQYPTFLHDYFLLVAPCATPDELIELLNQTDSKGNNALMLAAAYQPGAVPIMLEAVKNLPEDEKKRIILHTNESGQNVLMKAAFYNPQFRDFIEGTPRPQPAATGILLQTFEALFDKEEIASFFTHTDNTGANFLFYHGPDISILIDFMVRLLGKEGVKSVLKHQDNLGNNVFMPPKYASERGVSAASTILAVIEKLFDKEEVRGFLKQINANGYNPLVLATEAMHQEDVLPIISIMQHVLDKQELADILKQIGSEGKNPLMMACGEIDIHEDNINSNLSSILGAMEYLKPKDKGSILKQTSACGKNSLMIALNIKFRNRRKFDANVSAIFTSINSLDDETKRIILKQSDKDDENSLTLAIKNYPSIVPAILQEIEQLFDEVDKKNILMKTDREGHNVFMLAAMYCPDTIPAILHTINSLSHEQDKRSIIKQCNKHSQNVLMLKEWDPRVIRQALKGLYLLTDKERTELLNGVQSQPETKKYFKKEELGFQLGLLIKRLEEEVLEYKEKDPTYYSELQEMSLTIKKSVQHYQKNTDQEEPDAEVLAKTCREAMQKIHHKRVFPKDLQSILIGILNIVSALLLVGLPSVIQAHNQKNKSLFFKTPIERLADKIERDIVDFSKPIKK